MSPVSSDDTHSTPSSVDRTRTRRTRAGTRRRPTSKRLASRLLREESIRACRVWCFSSSLLPAQSCSRTDYTSSCFQSASDVACWSWSLLSVACQQRTASCVLLASCMARHTFPLRELWALRSSRGEGSGVAGRSVNRSGLSGLGSFSGSSRKLAVLLPRFMQ